MMKTPASRHEILLIEDNPADVRLALEAWKEGNGDYLVRHATDGVEAMEMLRAAVADGDATALPALILLDLNLPRMDGRAVLRELKADPNLRQIPVVVLTTSSDEADISGCYSNAANSYVQKPVDFGRFVQIIRDIKEYWFTTSSLPQISHH